MQNLLPVSLALALAAPLSALANSSPDVLALRQEIDAIRTSYEARLQALEKKLQAAEAQATPSPAATKAAPSPTAPTAAPSSANSSNGFNPAISLILSGQYARTTHNPDGYTLKGFALPAGGEIGPAPRGFNLGESELGLSANIDSWLRGVAHIALHPDDQVSVEEAFIQTTALGHGLGLKAGRYLSGVGYLNAQHAHTWDFVDSPLAYQALLGTQYGDDGLQMKWVAPLDQFVEIGVELGRGKTFPGGDTPRNGTGMNALTVHTGGDLGTNHSWRGGVSVLNAKATDQTLSATDSNGNTIESAFTGKTRVWVADAVWKWAPSGNASRTHWKLQGEYLRSTRTGNLIPDIAQGDVPLAYQATQSGWYVQGVYQFMPRWRVGLRTEQLNPGALREGVDTGILNGGDQRPSKNSLMLDFNPSEFSRVRLQFSRDLSRPNLVDNQVTLQYQMSLGAHGAHSF